jgi:hypothetical protein
MFEQERVRCQCACDCPFLADLPPPFLGVRLLVPRLCPECEEAHTQKRGKCAGEPEVRIQFYRPSYVDLFYRATLG